MSTGRIMRVRAPAMPGGGRRIAAIFAAVALLFLVVGAAASANDLAARYEKDVHKVFTKFCHQCHNAEKKEGGLDLAQLASGKKAIEFSGWTTVAQRVLNREMPPQEEKQLSDEQWRNTTKWMQDLIASPGDCNQLATDVTEHFYRGNVMSRRLTRAEYNHTIRDLLGIDLRPADSFPADGAGGEGFDTVGDALFTNPILMEKYLAAADKVIETALPDEVATAAPADVREAAARILIAQPNENLQPRAAAQRVLEAFARRAYRRAVTAEEVEPLLQLFDRAQQRGDSYMASLRLALKGALVSPSFLFLVEPEPTNEGIYELGAVPLASRLSYFLWASLPDEELMQLADSGKLKETDTLRAQVKRMVADERSSGFAEAFATQWLGIDTLGRAVRPDAERFPEFDDELASAMRREAIEFVAYVFRENRSLLELLDSDYTFVNERLAKHYGIDQADAAKVEGPEFRRVALKDRNRGGLVGMACVLTANSYPLRTSPVLRGKWLLAEILGDKVPPPPPNVPSLPEDDRPTDGLTLRQQLEQHRTKAECSSCHSRLDPMGFGLENFDPIGRWRTEIAGQAVDAAGELPGGQKFNGPAELKQVLLGRKEEFLRNLTRKMLSYALGRDLNRFDDCVVRDTLKALEAGEYRSNILFEQIVLSYPFRHRYAKK